jgi:hypothetical protein
MSEGIYHGDSICLRLDQAYLTKGDRTSAIRSFEQVLRLKPDGEDAGQQLKILRANYALHRIATGGETR